MGWMNDAAAAVWSLIPRRRAGDPGPGDDFWYADHPAGPNHAGIIVTPDIALKASAVYACVKVLAETIASLPFAMFREGADGSRAPAPDHPLDEIIRFQPNATQTAVEFWEMMVLHGALRGTSYAEIVPGARGAVDALVPLHTDRVTPERLADGSLRFKVTDPRTGAPRTLLQEEVFRVPGLSSDGIKGLRAVDLAAEAIGLGMAADAYAARVFSNNLNIGGYLIHPKALTIEAGKELIQRLMERFAGARNAHRPIVLQEGMQFKPATMTGREAQLIEARKWQILEICRYWRIPPYMLGVSEGQPKSNVEQQALDLVKYTLRPWVRRIEQAVRRDLITAKRMYVAKFNMDALLRGDSAARAAYFSKALGSGGSPAWMTVNEVRVREGLNKSDDPSADTLAVGTNPSNEAPSARALRLTDGMPRARRVWDETLRELADDTLEGRAARLVRKHVAAVRKAAMRHAGDPEAFEEWASAFFGGEVSSAMQALGLPRDVARAYCAGQRDAILSTRDLEALLQRWEDDGADEIADRLAGGNDDDECERSHSDGGDHEDHAATPSA